MLAVYRFLKRTGQERRSCIRQIAFRLQVCSFREGHTPRRAMSLLGQCGPLNRLTVIVSWNCESAGHDLFQLPGVKKLWELRRCKKLDMVLEDTEELWVNDEMYGKTESFAEILQEELCKEPDTEAERASRLAKEDAERRKARFALMDPKWQAGLRKRF